MVKKKSNHFKFLLIYVLLIIYLSINMFSIPSNISYSINSVNSSPSQEDSDNDLIYISNDDELAEIANSGTGTVYNPYIISDLESRIGINGTTKHFRIQNCVVAADLFANCISVQNVAPGTATIINNTCFNPGRAYFTNGIFLFNSSFSTVVNNTCMNLDSGGGSTGIHIQESDSILVANNICKNNVGGIRISESYSVTITSNTCNDNGYGIWIDPQKRNILLNNKYNENFNSSFHINEESQESSNTSFLTLHNNRFTDNHHGIFLECFPSMKLISNTFENNGISLRHEKAFTVQLSSCIIVNNTFIKSNINYLPFNSSIIALNTFFNGSVSLINSDFNVIIWNMISENENYGIIFSNDSGNNIIYNNNFIANGLYSSQVYDNGTNNRWFNETALIGNYWSDYNGIGNYSIEGSAETSDPYPYISLIAFPSVSSFLDSYNISIDLIDIPKLTTFPPTTFSPITFSPNLFVRVGLFLFIVAILAVSIIIRKNK